MMRAVFVLMIVASCANSATPTSPSSSPSPSPILPPAIGGSVLIGDIAGTKKFAPKPTLDAAAPALLDCYNRVRAAKPGLAGKLKLHIHVNDAGDVLRVDSDAEGSANDPALVACIGDALKTAKFPKPGGMATVVAPLLFRP